MRNPLVLRSQLVAAKQSMPPLQRKVAKLEKDNAKLTKRNAALKADVQKLRSALQTAAEEIQARVLEKANAEAEIKSLHHQGGGADLGQLQRLEETLARLSASFEAVKMPRHLMTGPNTACVQLFTGQKFFVDTADLTVGMHIAFEGNWESYLINLFLKELKEDSVFMDVGANCGFFSVVAASVIRTGRIIAVEPNPNLCKLINSSLYANAIWPYAKCLNNAVSDTPGEVTLNFDPTMVGGGSLNYVGDIDTTLSDHPPWAIQRVAVQAKTLDTIAAEQKLPRVDFIKIDVEGWEEHVFRSMGQTIANNPQLKVLLEFSHSAYPDAAGFFMGLKGAFKHVAQIMPDGTLTELQNYDDYLKSLWTPWGNLLCRNA